MRSSIQYLSIISAALITVSSGLPFSQSDSNSSSKPGSFALPLTRRSTAVDLTTSPTDRGSLLLGRVAKAKGKFQPATTDDDVISKRGSAGFVQLGSTPDDTSYYATILLGTPPVAFEVALDTGSSDLIIVTDPCYTGCYSDTQLYRPQDSSTAQVSDESFYIGYVSGSASGLVVADTMGFAGFSLPQQIFGAVNRSDSVVSMGGVSGLLGMAFQPLSATGAMPFVEALWKKNLLAQPLFSFGLARWGMTTDVVVPGGICTIGGTNSTLYTGSINYIPSSSDYFSIPLGNIASGGISLGISYKAVYIDTGTSLIYFPPASAATFYANIPGARDFGGGLYAYYCSATTLGISFTFGGVTYPMNDADFNIGYATEDGIMCYGAVGYIATSPGASPQFIFGDAFLKNVYSVFRFSPPAVGFATPANPGNVLQSGYVPTGNGTTIQQGANSTGLISRPPAPVQTAIPTTVAAIVNPTSTATPVPTPSSNYVAPVAVKSMVISASISVSVSASAPATSPVTASVDVNVAPVVVAPKANIQPIPSTTPTLNISTLAAVIQEALVATIASNTFNAVLILTCEPPKVIIKTDQVWTCSS